MEFLPPQRSDELRFHWLPGRLVTNPLWWGLDQRATRFRSVCKPSARVVGSILSLLCLSEHLINEISSSKTTLKTTARWKSPDLLLFIPESLLINQIKPVQFTPATEPERSKTILHDTSAIYHKVWAEWGAWGEGWSAGMGGENI